MTILPSVGMMDHRMVRAVKSCVAPEKVFQQRSENDVLFHRELICNTADMKTASGSGQRNSDVSVAAVTPTRKRESSFCSVWVDVL